MCSNNSDLAKELSKIADNLRNNVESYERKFERELQPTYGDAAGIYALDHIEESEGIESAADWWRIFLPLVRFLLEDEDLVCLATIGMHVEKRKGDHKKRRQWVNFCRTKVKANNLNSIVSYVSESNAPESAKHMLLLSQWAFDKKEKGDEFSWICYRREKSTITTNNSSKIIAYEEVNPKHHDDLATIPESEFQADQQSLSPCLYDARLPYLPIYKCKPNIFQKKDSRIKGYQNWTKEIFCTATSNDEGYILLVPPLYYAESGPEYRTAVLLVYLTPAGYAALSDYYGLLAAVFHCGSIVFQENSRIKNIRELFEELQQEPYWPSDCPGPSKCVCPQHTHYNPSVCSKDHKHCVDECFGRHHWPWIRKLFNFYDNDQSECIQSEYSVKTEWHESRKRFAQGDFLSLPLMLLIVAACDSHRRKAVRESFKCIDQYNLFLCACLKKYKQGRAITKVDPNNVFVFIEFIQSLLLDPIHQDTRLSGLEVEYTGSKLNMIIIIEVSSNEHANNIIETIKNPKDKNKSLQQATFKFLTHWKKNYISSFELSAKPVTNKDRCIAITFAFPTEVGKEAKEE